MDDRYSANVVQVNGKLYAVHTITPLGGQYSQLRWLILDANTGALIEEGTIGEDGYDYYQGSIAVNEFGQAVIGYNRSGFDTRDRNNDGKPDGRISIFAQVLQTDTGGGLDLFGDPTLLSVSDVSDYRSGARTFTDTSCRQRWGDYAAVTIDPLDHDNFWLIGEYPEDWFVDSSTTSTPGLRWREIAWPVLVMYEMSGSRFLLRGVGTQMMTASTSATRAKSPEAMRRPLLTASRMSSPSMCSM